MNAMIIFFSKINYNVESIPKTLKMKIGHQGTKIQRYIKQGKQGD
jgi:hypothetical protein